MKVSPLLAWRLKNLRSRTLTKAKSSTFSFASVLVVRHRMIGIKLNTSIGTF